MTGRLRESGRDFRDLFLDWGKYYANPTQWKLKGWILFISFAGCVVISAYFDEPVRYLFFSLHSHFTDKLAGHVHWYGTGYATLYAFLGLYLLGLGFGRSKLRIWGLRVLQSYLYSGAITISVKSLVGRLRPFAGQGHLAFTPFVAAPNSHLSFPSGDVAVAFALSVIIAGMWENKIWKTFWILLAIVTSISRIYYDAHWFSDVVFSTVNAAVAGIWLLRLRTENSEEVRTQKT